MVYQVILIVGSTLFVHGGLLLEHVEKMDEFNQVSLPLPRGSALPLDLTARVAPAACPGLVCGVAGHRAARESLAPAHG